MNILPTWYVKKKSWLVKENLFSCIIKVFICNGNEFQIWRRNVQITNYYHLHGLYYQGRFIVKVFCLIWHNNIWTLWFHNFSTYICTKRNWIFVWLRRVFLFQSCNCILLHHMSQLAPSYVLYQMQCVVINVEFQAQIRSLHCNNL